MHHGQAAIGAQRPTSIAHGVLKDAIMTPKVPATCTRVLLFEIFNYYYSYIVRILDSIYFICDISISRFSLELF